MRRKTKKGAENAQPPDELGLRYDAGAFKHPEMKRVLLSLLLTTAAFSVLGPIRAANDDLRASTAEVRREVIAAIATQLAAFRAGDIPQAYRQASLTLREQMPLRAFAAIVQQNYPEIWGNARAEYGIVRDNGTHATVIVHIAGEEGDAGFDYVLLKERGGWRIGSVLRRLPRKRDSL